MHESFTSKEQYLSYLDSKYLLSFENCTNNLFYQHLMDNGKVFIYLYLFENGCVDIHIYIYTYICIYIYIYIYINVGVESTLA